MKGLAITDYHNHSFITPDPQPVKNATYLEPPQSGAPYQEACLAIHT